MERKLTEKQKRFIDFYIETGNATETANLQSPKLGDKVQGNKVSSLDDIIIRLDEKLMAVHRQHARWARLQEHASCRKGERPR